MGLVRGCHAIPALEFQPTMALLGRQNNTLVIPAVGV